MHEPVLDRQDEILWHYTTAQGLLGIIGTSSVWATDARFLNDSRELWEAIDANMRILDQPSSGSLVEELWVRMMQPVPGLVEAPGGIFVSSWSKSRDQLSQWRGYAKGGGYSVGVRRSAMEKMDAHLIDVEYGLPEVHEKFGIFWMPSQKVRLNTDLVELARYKNAAFSEEKEVRLVRVVADRERDPELVKYRQGSLGLTPYVCLDLPADAITEVMVGPGQDSALRQAAVSEMVSDRGLNPTVSASQSPFRA